MNIPYKVCDRRPGDVDELWADIGKATSKLSWRPKRSLTDMCADSWKWQSQNPQGYRTKAEAKSVRNGTNGSHHPDEPRQSITKKVKALNGKGTFAPEVNNNNEEVAAFE